MIPRPILIILPYSKKVIIAFLIIIKIDSPKLLRSCNCLRSASINSQPIRSCAKMTIVSRSAPTSKYIRKISNSESTITAHRN